MENPYEGTEKGTTHTMPFSRGKRGGWLLVTSSRSGRTDTVDGEEDYVAESGPLVGKGVG